MAICFCQNMARNGTSTVVNFSKLLFVRPSWLTFADRFQWRPVGSAMISLLCSTKRTMNQFVLNSFIRTFSYELNIYVTLRLETALKLTHIALLRKQVRCIAEWEVPNDSFSSRFILTTRYNGSPSTRAIFANLWLIETSCAAIIHHSSSASWLRKSFAGHLKLKEQLIRGANWNFFCSIWIHYALRVKNMEWHLKWDTGKWKRKLQSCLDLAPHLKTPKITVG